MNAEILNRHFRTRTVFKDVTPLFRGPKRWRDFSLSLAREPQVIVIRSPQRPAFLLVLVLVLVLVLEGSCWQTRASQP